MNQYLIAIICLLSTFGAVSGAMALYFFHQLSLLLKEYQKYVKKEIQEVADSANISTRRLNQAGIATNIRQLTANSPSEARLLGNLYRHEASETHSAYPDQETQHHE